MRHVSADYLSLGNLRPPGQPVTKSTHLVPSLPLPVQSRPLLLHPEHLQCCLQCPPETVQWWLRCDTDPQHWQHLQVHSNTDVLNNDVICKYISTDLLNTDKICKYQKKKKKQVCSAMTGSAGTKLYA